jgi:murein L,D-transpeptidase YcbB/YkuD
LAGKSDLPQPVSREQARAEVLAAKPELAGIIDKLPGQTLTALAAKLEEQNTAQRDRFQQSEGRQGLAALSNALISAGEATRGQKGSGFGAAFGGFGKAFNASTQATEERAAKQQALERAQTIETMKLQADIEQMKRAYGEGRIDEAMRLKEQINARQAKIEEMKGSGATEVLNQADKLATQADRIKQRDEQARHNKEVERYQQTQANTAAQRAKFDREDRPTGEDKKLTKVMSILNSDPEVKSLLKRREGFNPGDPEFDAIQDVLDGIRDAAFKDAKLTPPTKRARLQAPPPPPKKGWFGDTINPVPSATPNSSAVPFSQLPK